MITVITGLPGNGKTLFAIWYIKKYAESQNRDVYYSGIKNLMIPWTECDPQKWYELPIGSIIVIDEAQTLFPRKPNGATLPEFYNKLATHRHDGHDIFLITQHPSLIDNFVRQLAGRHFHCVRKFGMARSTIYEWSAVQPTPQNLASRKSAIPLKWPFPTEVYSYYKSAEVHTVKRSIPAKLILTGLFILGVVVFAFLAFKSYEARARNAKQAVEIEQQASAAAAPVAGSSVARAGAALLDPVADAKNFVYMNTPRVKGLAHTAPKYDELTRPRRVPVPSMCFSSAKSCKCYTQQATPIDVDAHACRQFAKDGFFQEFDPDGERSAVQQSQTGDSPVRSSSSQAATHNQVASFAHDSGWYKAGSSAGGGAQAKPAAKP